MSVALTRWNLGWYLCIEFRIVCNYINDEHSLKFNEVSFRINIVMSIKYDQLYL